MNNNNFASEELAADFSSPTYMRVVDFLTEKIRSGNLAHGEILPPEAQFAKKLNCSRVTLRHALQILEQKGLIIKRRGRYGGNFINYSPDRQVVKKKNIGLVSNIVSPATEPYFTHLLAGIQNVLIGKGKLHLIAKESDELQDVFEDHSLDGMLLIGCERSDEELYGYLEKTGMPHVIISSFFDFYVDRGLVSCDTDNFSAGMEAMRHLIGLGHSRIGYIGCSCERSNQLDRFHAYKQALSENDIAFDEKMIFIREEGASISGYSYNAAMELMQQPDRPTAIFVAGFDLALEAIRAVKKCDLRVPEDISIVGFDDYESALHMSPPLTTVRQPLEELGRQSALKLWEWVTSGIVKNRRLILPSELVVRGSTAVPKLSHLMQT